MKKVLSVFAIALISFMFLGSQNKVSALSCLPFESYTKAMSASDLVFQGKVVSERNESDGKSFEFEISNVWKGKNDPQTRLYQAEADIQWSYTFEQGKEYIVFAKTNEQGNLNLPLCGVFVDVNNDINGEVAKVTKELGQGEPVTMPAKTQNVITPDMIVILGSSLVMVLILVGIIVIYRKDKK